MPILFQYTRKKKTTTSTPLRALKTQEWMLKRTIEFTSIMINIMTIKIDARAPTSSMAQKRTRSFKSIRKYDQVRIYGTIYDCEDENHRRACIGNGISYWGIIRGNSFKTQKGLKLLSIFGFLISFRHSSNYINFRKRPSN